MVSVSLTYIKETRVSRSLNNYTKQQIRASEEIIRIKDDILRHSINHDQVLPLLDQLQGYTILRHQMHLAIERESQRLSKPLIQRIFRKA